ncbi:hypothetical protein GEMRC1_011664 [Eukaryota sp. GEM-RC1]
MTKTLIPQHIRLDTDWINQKFVHIRGKKADEIRKKVFDQVLTDKAVASTKSFVFRYSSILTDGISSCLVLMRKDLVDEDGNTFKDFTAKSLGTSERYIHSLSNDNIQELQLKEKRIVEWEVKQKSLEEEAKSTPLGLVKCSDAECGTYWNRDLNSAINIYSIIEATINGQGRPSALERSKTQTTDLESGKDTLARDQKKKKTTATKKKKTSTRKKKTSTGKKKTCGNCGQEGHNKRSCKNPPKEMSSPKRRSVMSVQQTKVSRKEL